MLIYFIILVNFKISLLFPICKEDENNCIKCNPTTKLCYSISDFFTQNSKGGCDLFPKCQNGNNNCIECQGNICKKCQKGYFPDAVGGCAYTKNCLISANGICNKCIDNYILIGKNITYCKSLNSEDLKNCEEINTLNGYCSNYTDGFFLNSIDFKCTKAENCSLSKYGICSQCNKGYYLDKKGEECKIQNETFINCKESLMGEKCDECDNNYFFDEKGKCIDMKYCSIGDNFNINKCKQCKEGFYPTQYKDACTTEINCYHADKYMGICLQCKRGFYLDLIDGKCRPNINNDEFRNCSIADENICISCYYGNALSEDLKCSPTKYCSEVYDGICISCIENYYLGLDNKWSNVENCIYTNFLEECLECKGNLYYDSNTKKCQECTGIFKGCKSGYSGFHCFVCKDDHYLNQTDNLCYSNEERGPLYKCRLIDYNGTVCTSCVENYILNLKNRRCSKRKGCKSFNRDNLCIECEKDYCLDAKSGECENNIEVREDKKFYFRCKRTNEEGDGCEICDDGYILSDEGLCIDVEHCTEKNEEGKCLRCRIDEIDENYCLNKDFGCVKTLFDKCVECEDSFDFNKCNKCVDGYEIGENDLCYKIEDNLV